MQIPEPPDQAACAPCSSPPTWRALQLVPDPEQAAVNAAGRDRVVAAIQDRTDNEEYS